MKQPVRALLYDVARGMRGDVDYLEKLIVRLADYGYNMLVLYLEYRFQFPSHPAIGNKHALTQADARHLDQVARSRGIELVPCVNCAGHCEGIGYLEMYKHLSADPSGLSAGVEQLRVADPNALALIEDLYRDLFACFQSSYFHIGADEIRQLDRQMEEATEEQRWDQAMRHILHVIQFVKDNGKTPMMFGDMLLKHKSSVGRIPDDVIICDWAAFSDPLGKALSNTASQRFFKDAGKRAIACPSVNSYMGHPIVSVNSTMNIVSFVQDQQEVFGPDTNGVMLNLWEFDNGNFFSKQWPWVYMLGRLHAGETFAGLDFLQAYTKLEWGIDTDELKVWYDLVDVQTQKLFLFHGFVDEVTRAALTPVRSRSYKLLRGFMIDMLQSVNILPVLHRSRSWMNAAIRAELTDNYEKARIVAASMAHNAVNRREEPEMLLEWTVLFLTMLKMIDLLERAQTHYSDAAKVQYAADADGFRAQLEACCLELREIARLSDALVRWTALMIEREHAAPEEGWWVNRVGQDILDRAAMLEAIGKDNSRALVNFNVFLRLEPQLPFVPRYMKKQLRW